MKNTKEMTREEIGQAYEKTVGYNIFEDSPDMDTEEGRDLLESYLNLTEEDLREVVEEPAAETFDVRECPDCGRPINEGTLCPDCLKIRKKEQLKDAIALVRQHANVLPDAGAYSLKAGLDAIGRHSELLSAIVYIDEILLPKEGS